jgi:hypothetical protein
MVPAGTPIDVRLDSKISTENQSSGDTWSGTVYRSVMSGGQVAIPAGSPVTGVVMSSVQGTHETRPQIALALRTAVVDGRTLRVNGETEPIVAGSNRAKKVGAIVGGAAVGALLGHAVGRSQGLGDRRTAWRRGRLRSDPPCAADHAAQAWNGHQLHGHSGRRRETILIDVRR